MSQASAASRAQGWIYGILGAVGFSVVAVIVHRHSSSYSAGEFLLLRSVVALIALSIPLRGRFSNPLRSSSHPEWLVGVFGACAIALYFFNLHNTRAGVATTLHNFAPIFVALLSPVSLGVPLRRRTLVGTCLAAAGVACVAWDGGGAIPPIGIFVGILGGVAGAVSYIFMKRATASASASTVIWVTSVNLLVLSLAVFGWPKQRFFSSEWREPLLLALLALGAQLLTVRSYYFLDAITASVISLTPVLWTILYDITAGEVSLGPWVFAGLVAMALGLYLTHHGVKLATYKQVDG